MTELNVKAVLLSGLAKHRDITSEQVLLDLEGGGTIDSLEGIVMIVCAEKEFGIKISDKEVSSSVCQSISELVTLVQAKLSSSD